MALPWSVHCHPVPLALLLSRAGVVAEEPWGGSRRVRRVPKLVCMALEEQGAGAEFHSCREA